MRKFKTCVLLAALAVILAVAPHALNNELIVKVYPVMTDKVDQTVRIVLIADLHSRSFGKDQQGLLRLIDGQHPDLVMLGGDIFDKDSSLKKDKAFIQSLSAKYPCFFVTGNNEFSTGKVQIIKSLIGSCGVVSLEGDCRTVKVKDQSINVCGIDDCKIGEKALDYQLEETTYLRTRGLFTILLAHHPEHIDKYLKYHYDLILSGHTHGGLFRIPTIMNGIYAPDQGFFPKYAGGEYLFGECSMIISRGMTKKASGIPRLFNPPELVVIDIQPKIDGSDLAPVL